MLNFIPDSILVLVYYALVIAGLICYFASKLVIWIPNPMFKLWQLPVELLGVAVLAVGCYLMGGYSTEMSWRKRVEDLQAQVAVVETKSHEVNTVIKTKIVTRTKVIKEKTDAIIKYIDRDITKYDSSCVIPQEFIDLHNQAADAK